MSRGILRISLLLLALVVVMSGFSAAQQFQPLVYYRVGATNSLPYGTVAADFNNDGFADVASAIYNKNQLAVLLNNGDGTFQPVLRFPGFQGPIFLAAGDLNNDGNIDLVAISQGGNLTPGALVVYQGNGDGSFSHSNTYRLGENATTATLADFNGDGKLDVAVANQGAGAVMVFLGNGNGSLQSPVSYRATLSAFGIAAADLNGDGHPDLAVSGGDNRLAILLNNGNGTFATPVNYVIGFEPTQLAIADLNRDGKLDLVVCTAGSQAISVLQGNGDGTFGTATSYSTSAIGAAPAEAVIADFNLDGKADLAVGFAQGNIALLYGNGDGTFQAPVAVPVNFGEAGLASADFDHDGFPDLVHSDSSLGRDGVLLNAQ